jgi:murein L,D-transpeptidase YafK
MTRVVVENPIINCATVLLILAAGGFAHAAGQPLPAGTVVDRIVVLKSARTLSVYHGRTLLKTYKIALGLNPSGRKQRDGDGRTPEGDYVIDFRKRDSQFHRALHISYPNAADRRRARRLRVSPGSDIMIHGLPNDMDAMEHTRLSPDWTTGCIAVTNEEIEELWRVVPNGTRIAIRP